MVDFNVHIGDIECAKTLDGKIHKPFYLDISKFPSLFISHTNPMFSDMDEITRKIMTKCLSFRIGNRVKSVIIDDYEIVQNSIFDPGTFRHDRPDSMLKRINTFASKLYEQYQQNPDMVPYTKFIILVNRIQGLEKEIIDLMPKLGPIGMYLIVADDAQKLDTYPYLFLNLFGKLTYTQFDSLENKPVLRYDFGDEIERNDLEIPTPEYVYVLERFRLQCEKYPIIYPQPFFEHFYSTLDSNRSWWDMEHNINSSLAKRSEHAII